MDIVNSLFEDLCSKQKLERDKVLEQIQRDYSTYDKESCEALATKFISTIAQKELPWETYHGILEAVCYMVKQNRDYSTICNLSNLQESLVELLTHDEGRVRISAGAVLGALCTIDEGKTYESCKDFVLNMIITNLERDFPMDGSTDGSRPTSPSSAQIFHDTAGWRNLETSMKCLESMILGSKEHFTHHIDQQLLELVFTALDHTNRFVRETGFTVCSALVLCPFPDQEYDTENSMETSAETYSTQLAKNLAKGMADNWSQVRHSASVATRNFLMNIPKNDREMYFTTLLPQICLNRYYVAEGVRLYSQETWQQVTGLGGKAIVEKYISYFISYYLEATKADNHAVREAACSCIAELGTKIASEIVRPHVSELISALIVCFSDDSWPVRDAACLACGNFVVCCFRDECGEYLDELTKYFFANLEDSIPSVRQGGAVALGAAIKVYGAAYLEKVLPRIEENVKGVQNQKLNTVEPSSHVEGGMPAYGMYGVSKRDRDNDPDLHSNKQMYSCGSLAPKLSRGGCSDCKFQRAAEPWEKAEGAIYLICEMSGVRICEDEMLRLLALVAEALHLKHYPAHFNLYTTVCKVLPTIAKGIGKRNFKESLSGFYDLIFYALTSDNELASTAASECLNEIAIYIGIEVLTGRLEMHNYKYARIMADKKCIKKP